MFKIFTLSIYIILNLRPNACETYTSVAVMEKLLKTQAHLIKSMTKSLKLVASEKERDILEAYLDNLKKEHELSRRNPDPEHYLGNPINSYTLITRLQRDLLYVERILNKTKIYKRELSLVYPTTVDAKGAAQGIVTVQIIYGLNISDLANGTLNSRYSKTMDQFVEHVSPMTTNDCLGFASIYFTKKDRSYHIAWLEEAYKKYSTDQKLCDILEGELVAQIGSQYYLMENWSKSIYWLEKLLELKTNDAKGTINALKYAKHRYKLDKVKPEKLTIIHNPFDIDTNETVMRLCRHESRLVARNASVVCFYAHGPHPFLILAPIKVEQLHRRPDITMFYEVISDKEIQAFKTYGKPFLVRSLVLDSQPYKGNPRTSQNCEMTRDHPEVMSVEKRIFQFTGLWSQNVTSDIDIANYGIGGSFPLHRDFFDDEPSLQNLKMLTQRQRIATTLFYLSEVEQGGATVFVKANLTVFPVKNAALFWYNLDPWGYGDGDTLHAACPVIRGSKWVATKWFEQIEQNIRIRCPPQAASKLPTNC